MFAAVHEGRPNEVWQLGSRVRGRWPDADVPWRAEVLAVLATAAAIAGRSDEVAPLAGSVVDDPAASTVALALAHRAWGLAARADDPGIAAEHFQFVASSSRPLPVSPRWRSRCRPSAPASSTSPVAPTRHSTSSTQVLRRGHESDDVFVVVLAHLVRARVLLRAGDVAEAEADLGLARSASAAMGQPWWTAAVLRTTAAVASFGPDGWAGSKPLWRQAIDFAASRGALGEVAITLRTAASIAKHLGEDEQAAVLFAAVPRSTAITVLPELFPQAMAELQADAPAQRRGRAPARRVGPGPSRARGRAL